MRRYILSFAAACILATGSAHAQRLLFTEITQDPKGAAMSGMDIASSPNFAAFGNPSLVPFEKQKFGMGISYQNWNPSSSNYFNLGGSYIYNNLSFSAAFTSGLGDKYIVMNDEGISTGEFTPTDLHIAAGLGWKVMDNLSLGASLGFLRQVLYDNVDNTTIDANIFASMILNDFTVSAGVKSLGKDIPTNIEISGKWDKAIDETNSILLAAEGKCYTKEGVSMSLGAQYGFKNMVFARAGYRYSNDSPIPSFASFGLGALINGVNIDASYLVSGGENSPGKSFLLGLGFKF